ncbi:mechanosensitive ion channel [Solirubrobacter sp. CPCC 204708]|uniref:Mechanosensitive ion channel family protein n=1 Tax=Solirubrobacter deserti TaxID=2282478 RepID=A0ABT4RCK1_9ACTN|nr:mechanosensitive ion channel domain-containing protein [Solirubrobacter deserti]MBE2317048.1 mechanosensitive ion channel [Solirubrobacter deserti]MDA0136060.1 mechanosensitive ion channel family protein [Solirubrobacter deserti]
MFAVDTATWINAGVSIGLALLIATLFDRLFRGRLAREISDKAGITREGATRLRFVRRLIYAIIVLIGIALALSAFDGISNLARGLLASGAIAAAVIGFAARQVLANFVAGIMLAVTQPIRVGDWVTFEGHYGVVEDVRLNYTILKTATHQRIVIPNEKLAGGVLKNDTLVVDVVSLDVSIWIPPEADAEAAIAALEDETGQEVTIAEAVPWGTRLGVGSDPVAPPDRAPREADLRRRCLARLRKEGLLRAGSN